MIETMLITCCLGQVAEEDLGVFDTLSQAMQDVGDSLTTGDPDGSWTLGIDPWIDQTIWFYTQPPPDFLQSETNVLYAPAINLMGTATVGKAFDFTVYAMASRGFDPTDESMEMILNEYFVTVRPFENRLLSLRAGQFGTCFGQWSKVSLGWAPAGARCRPSASAITAPNRRWRMSSSMAAAPRMARPSRCYGAGARMDAPCPAEATIRPCRNHSGTPSSDTAAARTSAPPGSPAQSAAAPQSAGITAPPI